MKRNSLTIPFDYFMQVDPHSFTNSFFQVDPNNPIITLPDGTTAQVVATQGVATVNQCDDDDNGGHEQQQQQSDRNHHLINPKPMIWQFVPTSQITGVTNSDGVTTLTNSADGTTVTTVDLSAVTESTIGQEGQHHILLTGEDGQSEFYIFNRFSPFLSYYSTLPCLVNSVSSQRLRNDHCPRHVPGCGCQHLADGSIGCICPGTLTAE
jgi:hypothetical protein